MTENLDWGQWSPYTFPPPPYILTVQVCQICRAVLLYRTEDMVAHQEWHRPAEKDDHLREDLLKMKDWLDGRTV